MLVGTDQAGGREGRGMTTFLCSRGQWGDLPVDQLLLFEDAVDFSRSLRSLELLPIQHLLF